ncbi:hypothetical protein LCGC14_1729790 [marine sediment metagenome]|uniref:Uncharacterized protein n=1 Tax=marine sediment metagenome TaxID=412755 RepID=A0A0F9K9N0_9ZZZZ
MNCSKCKSENTHKNGKAVKSGKQKYRCNDCGYNFEDLECKKLNIRFVRNKIGYDEYIKELCKYGRKRQKETNSNWGVKHPMICRVLGIYLQVFDPVIIHCVRNKEAVVKSCMRCYDFSLDQALLLYNNRIVMLDSLLGRIEHLEIDFTERLSEESIWEQIEGYFRGGLLTDKDCFVTSENSQRA